VVSCFRNPLKITGRETPIATSTYQAASTVMAVVTIMDFSHQVNAGCKNWLNNAVKNNSVLGFKNAIKKPLRALCRSGSGLPDWRIGGWRSAPAVLRSN